MMIKRWKRYRRGRKHGGQRYPVKVRKALLPMIPPLKERKRIFDDDRALGKRIITRGYRSIAKEVHPDLAGEERTKDFQRLTAQRDRLWEKLDQPDISLEEIRRAERDLEEVREEVIKEARKREDDLARQEVEVGERLRRRAFMSGSREGLRDQLIGEIMREELSEDETKW